MSDGLINLWKPEPDVITRQILGKLVEELGELTQAAARCLIQGIDEAEPVTGKVNRLHLREEIADVQAALQWLFDENDGLDPRFSARYERKLEGFRRWQAMLEAEPREKTLTALMADDPELSRDAAEQLYAGVETWD